MAGLAEPGLLTQAARLILCTVDHQIPSGLPSNLAQDTALFLDLDMAVLGAGPATFDTFEHGIAAEYVPIHGLARFAAGRAGFLQALLKRPRLFHSDLFHLRHDAAARDNMRRALTSLQQVAP